ncbi:hypothetical protein GIB67_006273, partial [Kingdonia uniflora]
LSEGAATATPRNTFRRNRLHDKQVINFFDFQQRIRVMHSKINSHLKLSTKDL